MKLYLTLEDGFSKIERVVEINVGKESCEFDGVQDICDSMLETLFCGDKKIKKEYICAMCKDTKEIEIEQAPGDFRTRECLYCKENDNDDELVEELD